MSSHYDAETIRKYFDDLGEAEWERLVRDPETEVSLAIHLDYLQRCIAPGSRVLEIGAGAGRFTIALAEMGCRVEVTDVSPVQLALNREKVTEAGFEDSIIGRRELDVLDMRTLNGDYDAVVCYGGPLSYVMGERERAAAECARVTRPGGPFLFSAMSLWGTLRKGLPFALQVPREANARILATGDITPAVLPGHGHYCHLYTAAELRTVLEGAGFERVTLSASGFLSVGRGDELAEVRADPARWEELLEMERGACTAPGCVDAGSHIVGVGWR